MIAVLAIPPPAFSDQAGAAAGPPASDSQLSPAPQPSTQQSPAPATPAATDDEKARLAVNPITGLTTAPASNFTSLTGKERWKLYWTQDYFSLGAYFKPTLFAAVLDQATDSPRQWGGGFSGFGLREASRIGSSIVSGTIRAPLAAALHEDVRYISDQRGGKRRLLHAVEYSFCTYSNQGHPTLNIAKLLSYYASTAISTTWRPGKHDLAEYTFVNGTEQLGLSVPTNILQEFWPNLTRKHSHPHAAP
jgi:hypothetical protein